MDCPTQPEDSWYERYSRQVREGHAQRKRDLEAVRAGEANARSDQEVPLAISEGQYVGPSSLDVGPNSFERRSEG